MKKGSSKFQFTFHVDHEIAVVIEQLAAKAGIPKSTFCRVLFKQAFKDKIFNEKIVDPDLDTQVARVGLLFGGGLKPEDIEWATGIPVERVRTIIQVWRDELLRLGE